MTTKYINTDVCYYKEVKVKEDVDYKNVQYTINGRIDSVIEYEDKIVIEEIKSVHRITSELSLYDNKSYLAQLLIYAYFHTKDIEDKKIEVMLTYISRSDEDKKSFTKEMSKLELLDYFMETIEQYHKFTKAQLDNKEEMEVTGRNVAFPYENYRASQRKFMSAVYSCIVNKTKLFAQAPTGVGKTLSTLFPSIKAMAKGEGKKIFYITAKSITKNVCIENLYMLKENGYRGMSLNITSKENICVNKEINCNKGFCERAEGHFDRLNSAILDIINNEKVITEEVVKDYAKKHMVCPYSFQLELIDFVHIVVCDYNYVYNPSVAFVKYFDKEKNDFIVLVDEAHNLEDRSRDFFSASIKKSEIEVLRDNIDSKSIKRNCKEIINLFNNYFVDKTSFAETSVNKSLINLLADLRFLLDEYFGENELEENVKEQLLNAYFSVDYMLKTNIYYDEKYKSLYEVVYKDLIITLYCIDTSTRFFKVNTLCRSVVFFSATLTPINYFSDIFGGSTEDFSISLDTSFDISKQLTVLDTSISTYYKDREQSYSKIADKIDVFINAKKGNYFVFFPSYAYLENVLEKFERINKNVHIMVQKKDMSQPDRESFLAEFEKVEEITKIAFLVCGGVFSEGVNLANDKLIGAIVVGVGISMLNFKSDTVKAYFDEKNGLGYEFAYMYQGFNKILQSAGRVIRSDEDRGAILMIDSRFDRQDYRILFPNNYQNAVTIRDNENLTKKLNEFWRVF